MKKYIVIALLLLSSGAFAQTAKTASYTTDAAGNFIASASAAKASQPATSTGKTFTDRKGVKHEVFASSTGSLFYKVISKAGKEYKKYQSSW